MVFSYCDDILDAPGFGSGEPSLSTLKRRDRATVYLFRDGRDEPFCAQLASLPGVLSEGWTKEEAVANIREAMLGAFESYDARQIEIPWEPRIDIPDAAEFEMRVVSFDE